MAECCGPSASEKANGDAALRVLLVGNPNVGKSALFSRLTGVNVIVSNYPGTTVEFTQGLMRVDGGDVEVIDIPGAYSLDSGTRAEKVAGRMLEESLRDSDFKDKTVVVNVVDSTNLERNLPLTLKLLKRGVPAVMALNFWDETAHTGIRLDHDRLSRRLGVPCIPTSALTGEGVKQLIDALRDAKPSALDGHQDTWSHVGSILDEVQRIEHKHHTFREWLGDFSMSPVGGLLTAAAVLSGMFWMIRTIGEGLIAWVLDPFFHGVWSPIVMKLSALLGGSGFFHDLVIGKVGAGGIEYMESFGVLTTGLYVPLAAVLPYVFAFYLVLSLLEDCGYLPRLAVLVDNLMHRLGVHGYAVIPMLLGLGCNVPGALSTRLMETRRERFIAAVLMAVAVPCSAQIAMVVGLMGPYGVKGLAMVFGTLFTVMVALGLLLNRFMEGHSAELFVEIPPYRVPYLRGVLKKVWMRVVWFLREAVPWVVVGVLAVNLMYSFGVVGFLGELARPVVSGVLGLPRDAVGALVIGFLRKDVAVGMLVPLGMSLKQLVIASVVLTMYFPCMATFAVLVKEFGVKGMTKAALIMISSTLVVGGILNLIL